MVIRRVVGSRSLLIALSFAILSTAGVVAQKKEDKKEDEAQRKETQLMVKIADDAMAGTGPAATNDLAVNWVREDFLKAQSNKQYVPFTVLIDPTKVGSGTVGFYWRAVLRSAPAPEPVAAPGKKDDKKDKDKDKKTKDYAYEDRSFVPVAGQTAPMRVSRSITVDSGTYDVYIVVKEPTPEKAPKNAPPVKFSVMKQSVVVPDFWNAEFNTSTILIAQRIDPLPSPLTPQQQADRPYALGTMEILPVLDTKFTKKGELSTFMLIYNPKTDANNKPDVSVEYNFCQANKDAEPPKAGEPCKPGEKFFNKTNATNLNAQTLPPQFDMAAGHQLQAGQAVPLASFPEGNYRLEIKVTDKLASKILTREIPFSVNAAP